MRSKIVKFRQRTKMLRMFALSAKPMDKKGSAGTLTVCRMHLHHVRVSARPHSSSSTRTQKWHAESPPQLDVGLGRKKRSTAPRRGDIDTGLDTDRDTEEIKNKRFLLNK